MKKEKTFQILVSMSQIWPDINVIPAMVETWHMALGDMDESLAEAACALVCRENRYRPVPKDLLDAATLIAKARGPRELSADEAFDLGREAARKFGASARKAAFRWVYEQSPRAAATIKALGFDRFCSCTDESRSFLYRDFVQAYADRMDREEMELRALPVSEQMKVLVNGCMKALPES